MSENQTTWLTQESYDRLHSELTALRENRPVLAAEINERREEGDLKENGGYHAAREQQGQEEARIAYLEELLDNATIGEAPMESGVALVGTVVHVYYDGDEDDKETFLIGTRGLESSNPDLETYSTDAPLGAAIVGAKEGETRTYSTPSGEEVQVTLVKAEPYDADRDIPRSQQ
ncbi:transcription elongation factor GreA [Corynebacterium sp. 320]|uniref:Transcription elongation factor GreA n=1 Tax=Corynebacterium zhongnanshanii TaxID=2768834 RepID=A0ABQ6VFD7_9CORY|nr:MULTISPECIES: transcription elongation factor GreA [Corynebacterium]KAB1504035.1 transcription elongation factor GreA [Corynebacterium sp. 320]KAB1552866.1 transcription elongation factor GreA [Corynebacterium sp. 321]KAB1553916.1 transcription elongation factor GreA [Corynebacterium sp. 319]KAB3523114.1 transcription elongation factor GreA [Corynebacterium zhongnanshanii]KAB3528171.1 transcription elongation factor GreA [Corynebacterium sp. 250]